ncbi:MAG: hypothetical protein KDG51_00350, partial [Calditrichaeota bacterium]|nr:hypothetical protein [Calditrichota bacterium]
MKCARWFIASFLLFLLPYILLAGKGEISFVETQVDLRADGSAVVAYTVQWRVLSGELHGFYFQGNDRLNIDRFSSDSYALDEQGNRYPLTIKRVNNDTWDIILADGQGIGSGTATYVFYFATNFASAGYLAPTVSVEGTELTVFNWSPVQWDEARNQDHYTLTLLTPHILPEGYTPREYVEREQAILTEPWVNSRFLIDYRRGPNDRLEVVFHKDNPGNRFDMRVQVYFPRAWFELPEGIPLLDESEPYLPESSADVSAEPGSGWRNPLFLGGAGLLLALFFFLVIGKHRSMVQAHQGLDEIRWDNLDWTPPKLIMSS